MTRDERSTVAWTLGFSLLFMTVIMVVAEESVATMAVVDSLAATGVIVLLLVTYSVVLVATVAWHRRPTVPTRRPMPRRPAPSSTRPRHGAPERPTLVDIVEAAAKRPEPPAPTALPWTPAVSPTAVEQPPDPKTRIDLDGLPGFDLLFGGGPSLYAANDESVLTDADRDRIAEPWRAEAARMSP